MNIAQKVREQKSLHPDDFCPHPGCLWRIHTARGVNPCRNHPTTNMETESLETVLHASNAVVRARKGATLNTDEIKELREYVLNSGRMWVARPVVLALLDSHERALNAR